MDFSVPGVGVFVATLVGFVASYLWFGPKTFYPVWWKALGKGAEMPNGGQNMGSLFGTALLATLPVRHRRAALGEAAKYAVLGDETLFDLLEADGAAIARGDRPAGLRACA